MAISACVVPAFGQDSRGRKYKAPPETEHIVVQVTKATNGKPVVNAAVVFHPVKDGKDEGNLEVKSDPDGKAAIDVIPIGSQVTVQVIATGFATFAEDFVADDPEKEIDVKLQRPKAQVSAYVDNDGKPSQMQPGVQEPKRPAPAPQSTTAPQANTTTSSASH
jgi:Carboxypeptidase regulatory-like domain